MAVAWLCGFVWFVANLQAPDPGDVRADGIVVLTGGADRVAEGLRLLRAGRGRALLISGVGKGVELPALEKDVGVDASGETGQIVLGRVATSTAGNAAEAADWVRREGLHSLLVVTASYHMKRAMTELQRTLPGVPLAAVPVLPPALRKGAWHVATLWLLAQEYTKFLAAAAGVSRIPAEMAEPSERPASLPLPQPAPQPALRPAPRPGQDAAGAPAEHAAAQPAGGAAKPVGPRDPAAPAAGRVVRAGQNSR